VSNGQVHRLWNGSPDKYCELNARLQTSLKQQTAIRRHPLLFPALHSKERNELNSKGKNKNGSHKNKKRELITSTVPEPPDSVGYGCPTCSPPGCTVWSTDTFVNSVQATKSHTNLGGQVHCLSWFLHVRLVNQPAVTVVALCPPPPKMVGCTCCRLSYTGTDPPRRTQKLRFGRSGVSRILGKSEFHIHMVNYTRLHEALQLKSQPTHITTLSAAEWLPCRLRYRPAVLLRHLRLTALSISKGKIQRAFKKTY